MFKVVNGYPCASGCDVALAKKGIDPRNPRRDPVVQERLDARDPMKAAERARDDLAAAPGAARADGVRPVDPTATAERAPNGLGRFVDRMA